MLARSYFLAAALCFSANALSAQPAFKILHYTETSGHDHGTRQVSLQLFQALGAMYNFQVDDDNDGSGFNSLSNLQQYAIVVFSNTSGNAILTPAQQTNFENYINGGGSLLGIHAASDTYRHSTANGANTGGWDWYAQTLGASVQENPNHVSGTPLYNLHKIGQHASTDNLPEPWAKNEEYYYWENGYYNSANTAVLEVEQTIGPNNQVNSYDSARPMSWYRNLGGGGKVFYTALGHATSNYTSDQLFIAHIRDAIFWMVGVSGIPDPSAQPALLFQNPVEASLELWMRHQSSASAITLCDALGKTVYTGQIAAGQTQHSVDLRNLRAGVYVLRLETAEGMLVRKVVKR